MENELRIAEITREALRLWMTVNAESGATADMRLVVEELDGLDCRIVRLEEQALMEREQTAESRSLYCGRPVDGKTCARSPRHEGECDPIPF